MAGNKIKGITVEIGGDTTGLDKALKTVNSTIKDTQAELKDVNKALKLDPGNTELLEQKQRNLAKAVEATAEKLDTLKTAQEQAQEQLERGDISQAQYDALTREIVETEEALKKAKKAQDEFNVSIESAKAKLDKVGSAASAVSEKTKGLSTAAAGLVGGIAALGVKSLNTADDLLELSQQTGISTDQLQKMQYASEMVDVSVESMTGALAKMKKQMATSAGAEKFAALGISIRDASGELRNADEVFFEALEALSQIENETERDLAAMDLFGKSADQLAGIIDDGGASLKEYGAKAEELGLIMSNETLTGLGEVKDKIDELKAQAGAQLAETGAKAIEALTPVIDLLIDKLSAVFEWIGSLDADTLQLILTIAAVVAAISPIAGIIATITTAISGVLALVPALQAAGAAVTAFAAANPIVLIAAAVAALALLIATHWDEVKEILKQAKEKVEEFVDKVTTFFAAAGESIKATWQNLKTAVLDIWQGIKDGIAEKINGIIEKINSLITKINDVTTKINNSGIGKTLGLNIGQIGTIPTVGSGNGATRGGGTFITNNYNTSSKPMQVNLNVDGQQMARTMVNPLQDQLKMMGGSAII